MFDWVNLLILGGFGLVALVVLWPTASNGQRLLKKWKVADPTPEQVDDAVRYLKRRRLLYPWLYVLAGVINGRMQGDFGNIVITLLIGTMLAELIALRPRRDRRREATLEPRGLFDIASPVVLGTCVVAMIYAIVSLTVWWNRPYLLVVLGTAAVVAVLVWAAVVRPASGDVRVDSALRTRSVHVTTGLATSVVLGLAGGWAALAGVFLWVAMANTPPRERESV